ncbi:alpha/beta-hydrolase [Aspergillus pseudoustus]|uniref:Alpha/beta-hydrolase n=1 Tax=Aspergillus pseudoustus TaxID=1810923 RepID=A0ABR4KY40_9EURO
MTTIVLVPGAWLTPAFYEPFLSAVREAGHPVHCAEYPSLDPADPTTADCTADTKVLTQTLRTLVEDEGRDLLLVLHSYAGMPGAAAATGLSKSERVRQDKRGGVVGMVFIAAFIVSEGISCSGLQGGDLPGWILLDKPQPHLNVPHDPKTNFAGDIDARLLVELNSYIKPHSTVAFNSPQPAPAWADDAFAGRLAAIVTGADLAVPKVAQYGMLAATQKNWIIREIDCSHCAPFISRIYESVNLVLGLLREFEGV